MNGAGSEESHVLANASTNANSATTINADASSVPFVEVDLQGFDQLRVSNALAFLTGVSLS